MGGKTPIVEVDVVCVWEWVERRDDMVCSVGGVGGVAMIRFDVREWVWMGVMGSRNTRYEIRYT